MKSPAFLAFALALASAAHGQTTAPATPTLHANADFKGLQFDWAPAAGASWYQLEYRAHQTGDFVQQGDDLPASATYTHFSFPLHLYDWTYARYRLAACNSAGCSRSAEVSVSSLRRDAVGYFKADTPVQSAAFGATVDLSADGYNFVSVAPGEKTTRNGTSYPTGAVYTFRRGSDGHWAQRARFSPPIAPLYEQTFTVINAAISGDGNTVAVGLPDYAHQEMDTSTGEVFVYRFNGASWSLVSLPRVAGSAIFGTWVGLDTSGTVLAVGVTGADTPTIVAIYKLTNGTWQEVRDIPRSVGTQELCQYENALSRDGKSLAQTCMIPSSASSPQKFYVRVWSGTNWSQRSEIPLVSSHASSSYYTGGLGISANGDTVAADISMAGEASTADEVSQVNVFKRTNGTYAKVAELTRGAWMDGTAGNDYGYRGRVSVSGDGTTIAIGDVSDTGQGFGPRAAPLWVGTQQTGAVYIYRLSGTWKLANMVKPNSATGAAFGSQPVLSNSGKTLIVGQGGESGANGGIGGQWRSTSLSQSGAVWMY